MEKPCQDRKRAKARGWQLNLEMIRENKSERTLTEKEEQKKPVKQLLLLGWGFRKSLS